MNHLIWLVCLGLAGCLGTQSVSFQVPAPPGKTLVLHGTVEKPDGQGPFPAIVLLHGCAGDTPPWGDPWARRLVDWGYAVMRFDSFDPRGYPNGICARPSAVGRTARADDAHTARRQLAALPFVDPNRIGVLGMSHGGSATLASVENTYLQDEPRAEPFKAAVALYPGCQPSLYRLDAPLMILIGEDDDWTFAFRCEVMQQQGPSRHKVALKVYPGAAHVFDV